MQHQNLVQDQMWNESEVFLSFCLSWVVSYYFTLASIPNTQHKHLALCMPSRQAVLMDATWAWAQIQAYWKVWVTVLLLYTYSFLLSQGHSGLIMGNKDL